MHRLDGRRALVIRRRHSVAIAAASLLVAAAAAVARPAGLHPYVVPYQAMEPTLTVGETVYVGGPYRPSDGDVVVFHAPSGANALVCGVRLTVGMMCPAPAPRESNVLWIDRVAAGPGERIAMSNGHVILNGKPQNEPYIDLTNCVDDSACTFPKAITVPAGHYFMLSDSRGESGDSRFWGPVPLAWIVGRAQICSASSCHYVP